MTQAIKDTKKDVSGKKCAFDDEAKLHAWKEHFHRHLCVEFPWDKNSLNN